MLLLESVAGNLLDLLPLAAGEPVMDGQTSFRVISRALHILCAIMLGGGIFYMRSVLAPSGPEACFADRRQVWARWVMIASTLLLATGLFNYIMYVRDGKVEGATPLPSTYHTFFGIKFLLALVVMFIGAFIAGRSSGAEKARTKISTWLNAAWTIVMAIVILGSMMRFMH
jgi:hypothetical protein